MSLTPELEQDSIAHEVQAVLRKIRGKRTDFVLLYIDNEVMRVATNQGPNGFRAAIDAAQRVLAAGEYTERVGTRKQ